MKNITALILIVLSVGLYFFSIRTDYAAVQSLRVQKQNYTNAIESTKQIKTQSDTLVSEYNSISENDKTKLSEMIPEKFDLVSVTSKLNAMAAHYGMIVKSVQENSAANDTTGSRTGVLASQNPSAYAVHTITFSTTGQYGNFINFLRDIESNVELMDVKEINIGQASVSGNSLTFTVTVDTYSLE